MITPHPLQIPRYTRACGASSLARAPLKPLPSSGAFESLYVPCRAGSDSVPPQLSPAHRLCSTAPQEPQPAVAGASHVHSSARESFTACLLPAKHYQKENVCSLGQHVISSKWSFKNPHTNWTLTKSKMWVLFITERLKKEKWHLYFHTCLNYISS